MQYLAKLEFAALDISGKNYLSWVLDAEIHLDAKGLGNTILADKEASNQDKTKAMIFIRHHLHEGLKVEYLTVKDPLELRKKLKERFDHQKTVILPKARYDWMDLRLQDFKTQYREKGFKRYSELISCLLVADQNNELLMKNHGIRPTSSAPFTEVNVAVHNNYENRKYRSRGRGRGRSEGRGRGRISNRYHGGHNNDTSNH
ncbi:uncharacterized protein [Gossypium hirsutum]|uniref:Uncharacterized protein n=1 Tax=Gossypium hirsutum TaxID=3635 RepID=A0ABM2YHP9_GOSHI|nr:uncharacterized protein LOC121203696 [Gossypium hirsutum]